MLRCNVVLYCNKCRKQNVHKFIASETDAESPLTRLFFGIFTLGFSEMLNDIADKKYYKCIECGNIRAK